MDNDPIRPTNDEARTLARRLIDDATFAALAVISHGAPMVTRIAIGTDFDGTPLALVSDLSTHTKALRSSPAASILLGEPEKRGDPLTHPRLTVQARADFVEKSDARIDRYLAHQPKAKLYIGFGDFHFVRFTPSQAQLIGGFGQAFHLTPQDLQI